MEKNCFMNAEREEQMKKMLTIVSIALFILLSSHVSALTVYTDRAAWESATGSFITENFNNLTPFQFTTGLNSVGLIDVDVTGPVHENQLGGPSTLNGQFAIDRTNHLIGHVLNGGITHPTIIFQNPVYSFAADWRTTLSGGRLIVLEFDGQTIHFDDYLSGDGSGFLGVIADNAFSQVVFGAESTDAEAFGMDNLSFSPVPEPMTMALLGLGGLLLRRRKS